MKILCFGEMPEKYKTAIHNAMRENENITEFAIASDDNNIAAQQIDGDTILMKCDIHSDDFLRRIIAINKIITNGQKFTLTHCAVFHDCVGRRAPFILTDAACVPMPDETQLTYIVNNAVSLYSHIFNKGRAPYISLISAGGDTNTKLAPVLHQWRDAHITEFAPDTLHIEQLDVALNMDVRHEKHMTGNAADIVVVDHINTGNAILKSLTVLTDVWECACFLMGAQNIVVLNSRSATAHSLTQNILLAVRN